MMSKGPFLVLALALLALSGLLSFDLWPAPLASGGKPLQVQLTRGPFTVFDFPPRQAKAQALVLFGSGDGGWGSLEESICHAFQAQGYAVAGIDFTVYAQTDYSLDILQADDARIAAAMRATLTNRQAPLIIAGYSMGAAQAIAAAGGPHPPPGLIGLLVVDPLSRGRYGLREADKMNELPEGPGTFAAASFAGTMAAARVTQWHAEEDTIDSHAWLDLLTVPHRFFVFPGTGHSYAVNRPDFVRQLTASVAWIVDPAPETLHTVGTAP